MRGGLFFLVSLQRDETLIVSNIVFDGVGGGTGAGV